MARVDMEIDGGVARIFLNRPQKVNALDAPLLEDLTLAVQKCASFRN